MSYTYPEALIALESIANDYIKLLRPAHLHPVHCVPVRLVCELTQTASVTWDQYEIRVTMPVRPATSAMTQAEFEDWTAYLLHELGHPTHTDKAAWIDAVKAGISNMVNALEDVRMEKALIASGIVLNAKAVLSRLVSRKVVEARTGKQPWNPNARREFGWTVCVLGRAANGYAIDASDLAWIKSQIKPGSTVDNLLGWVLPALAACTSTRDCVSLAERIAGVLAATPQSTQNADINPGQGKDEAGDGKAGDKGEAGEADEAGEGEGEGEGESDQGKGEAGETPDEAPTASDAPSSDNEGEGAGKGGKGHGDGTTDADETPVTDAEQAKHELAPEGEAMTKHDAGSVAEKLVIDILRDKVMQSKPRNEGEDTVRRMTAGGARMKAAAAEASRQRALLARALRANETEDREGGRRAGRLDKGALTRAMAGASNVFARREISEGYDTDVTILLDASGSMSGHNMISALEAGLIIAQAAGSVGASCTTEIFNSTGYRRAGGLASKRTPNPADFGALQNSACGGTPLSAHMARAAVSQAKRAPQKRRVLFVVTDGGCDYGPQTVKRMATYLEQAHGTVLAHVSIGTPLQGSFRAEVCVPFGTPLAQVGLEHFVKVLQAL